MRRLLLVLTLLFAAEPALAGPPSGYACAPGTTNKGVGCTCPAKHREKRDAEGVALCAAAPTATALQQLLALLAKNNLAGAIEVAKKFDFDQKAQMQVMNVFAKRIQPIAEQIGLLSSRGQCSGVRSQLDAVTQWRKLFVTIVGTHHAKSEYKDEVVDALESAFDDKLAPLFAALDACIATATKDDGSAQIKPVYEANRQPLKKCFEDLPEPKVPMTAKIVIDADGAVADVVLTVIWPDLDVKLVNARLEMVRLEEMSLRSQCFRQAINAWKFKPNARGFAATISIPK